MTSAPAANDLSFVLRVVDLLASCGLRTWLSGGWADELRGLVAPCAHAGVDLLYPAPDFARVDRIVQTLPVSAVTGKRLPHKRAFTLDGVLVELVLVCRDEEGWKTELPGGTHRWPPNVFAANGRLPAASVDALQSYRAAHASLRRAA